MKRSLLLSSLALLLSACSMFHSHIAEPAPTAPPAAAREGLVIEKVPFRVGVSSATVEKMARSQSCTGGAGAGLVTQAGPVEVYRMLCDNGKVFMARCELRQCKPM